MSRAIRIPCVRFAAEVLQVELTTAQRVHLGISVDGVQPRDLKGEEREIARALVGDVKEVEPQLRRILVWRLGRASGKTTLAAIVLIWCAWTALLRGGKGHVAVCFIVSPTTLLARIAFGVVRELVRESAIESAVVRDVDDVLVLRRPDGRRVEVRSVAASKGGANLRGRDVVALVVDESEFMGSGDDVAVSDADQLSAVTPRLLEFAILSSTPWPTENATAQLFDRNWGHPVDALALRGPSLLMRPGPVLEQDRAREMARDEANAAREYDVDASAMRGSQRFFDAESVLAAVDPDRPLVILRREGMRVAAGGDVAFERDSCVVLVAGRGADGVVEVLEFDELRPTRGAPLVPGPAIRDRFAPVMRRHGTRSLWADAHYRQSVTEHLTACELAMVDMPGGNQGKFDSYVHVRDLLRSGKLRIPNSPRLIAQLRSVTATPMDRGLTKISSPRRAGQGHGDVVSALVAACWALREDVEQQRAAERYAAKLRGVGDAFVLRGRGSVADEQELAERQNREMAAALHASTQPAAVEKTHDDFFDPETGKPRKAILLQRAKIQKVEVQRSVWGNPRPGDVAAHNNVWGDNNTSGLGGGWARRR